MSTPLDLATDRMMALLPAHIRLLDEANGGALRGLMRARVSPSLSGASPGRSGRTSTRCARRASRW